MTHKTNIPVSRRTEAMSVSPFRGEASEEKSTALSTWIPKEGEGRIRLMPRKGGGQAERGVKEVETREKKVSVTDRGIVSSRESLTGRGEVGLWNSAEGFGIRFRRGRLP